MSKSIEFEFEGKQYCLEFTKQTVRTMERRGFVAEEFSEKPMTMLPDLFAGAFLANHSSVKRDKIDKIYRMMGDKTKLIGALTEMYNEPIEALLAEPEDGKNLKWTPSWESEEEE